MSAPIKEIMTGKIEFIDRSSTALVAAKKMQDKNISSVIVIDNNNIPVGIVTERDLARRVCTSDTSSKNISVDKIMSSPLITIDPNSPIEVAADIMVQNKVRHLLVVDEGEKPVGIITPTDFTFYLKKNIDMDQVNTKILEALKDEGRQV